MFIFIERMKYDRQKKKEYLQGCLSTNPACNNCKYFKKDIITCGYRCKLTRNAIFPFGYGVTECKYRKERKHKI